MNHRSHHLLTCLALTLLGLAPIPLLAQAPDVPATPTVPATPDAPAASAADTIAQARTDQKAGRFAEALARLQPPPPGTSPADTKAMQLVAAEVQYAWAQSLAADSPAQSLPHFRAALAIDRTQRPADAADDFNEMGIAYEQMDQHGSSIDACRQALALYGQVGDKNGQARALDNLGIATKRSGQTAKAIGLYRRSVALHRLTGDKQGQADALDNLGLAYDALGQYGKAVGPHRQALLLFRQVGDEAGAAEARDNLDIARKRLKSR